MQAYRNVGGTVRAIKVDVDPGGAPILPPDTTVDPRPEPMAGHYVTVVGKAWVQIPIPISSPSVESLKSDALTRFSKWRDWYINRPVEHEGRMFDADELSRSRVTQALTVHSSIGFLPPAWLDVNKAPFPLADIDTLKGIATAILTSFNNGFFEAEAKRAQILATSTAEELAGIEIPEPPMLGDLPL